ncbi:MAG: metalloregulator ArsR/SmtB family transcription factor [Rhizobiaceae bacterium]
MVDYLFLSPILAQMVNPEVDKEQLPGEQLPGEQLTDVLKAVSDPTRREILTKLVQEGHIRVTDIAAYFDMSLNSVSKHIKVLEAAGLVSRDTVGRTHLISANMEPVKLVDQWFTQLRSIWDMRLERLDAILTKETPDE